MNASDLIDHALKKASVTEFSIAPRWPDEVICDVPLRDWAKACLAIHQESGSPVMAYFAQDERKLNGAFTLVCLFLSVAHKLWVVMRSSVPENEKSFPTLSRDIISASLFEREIEEGFGLMPLNSPDHRRLHLHEEVWPEGSYPMLKDWSPQLGHIPHYSTYEFAHIEGEGIFEVPVGPVHAGIIGPGHFKFSVAGEPIINLEARLGFTHKGVEKLLEGKDLASAIRIVECVSGDSSFAYGWAFCKAAEKILGIHPAENVVMERILLLELERIYNHVNDVGGIALDVGFSFPSAFAALMKERILALNAKLTGSRYLKKVTAPGGALISIAGNLADMDKEMSAFLKDLNELESILSASASFIDRVESTGILRKKTASDLGVLGLSARASGVALDMREVFPEMEELKFQPAVESSGDVLSRLRMRLREMKESMRIIGELTGKIRDNSGNVESKIVAVSAGHAIGCVEAWRGPILIWLSLGDDGHIERCKIVDSSFRNWAGITYAVLGEIIPDFPVCNKSFDLSYSGNDL